MIRVGLVGFGYWWPNYARILSSMGDAEMAWCADTDAAALERVSTAHPHVRLTKNYRDLLVADDCDAVIVATPTVFHEDIARATLQAGKPILVEKPLTNRWESAASLALEAEQRGAIAVTGHVYLFSPAVRYICDELERGVIGNILYMTASRMGFSPIRADVDALWDLAPHDLSMFMAFTKTMPRRVSATASAYIRRDRSDVAFARLEFPGNVIANIGVSWDCPFKERRMLIVGSHGTIACDDLSENKLTVYHSEQKAPLNRAGVVDRPTLDGAEPLERQLRHFLDCIRDHERSPVDFKAGADVVRVLQALSESVSAGLPVDLDRDPS